MLFNLGNHMGISIFNMSNLMVDKKKNITFKQFKICVLTVCGSKKVVKKRDLHL